jgi:predicted short-subunit dehydrogenase-like oxidoreductase (DUF2520 family)
MEKNINIGLIGSGNVATHLSKALVKAGHRISWVYSKTKEHAQRLALETGSITIDDIGSDLPVTDIIIISVNDDAVKEIAAKLKKSIVPLVHTSGSLPMDALLTATDKAGVLYPLQTFTRSSEINMQEVPFCIEASDNTTLKILETLASAVSDKVIKIDSRQRLCLHIAAIFANNFSNYMYVLAGQVLQKCNLSPELLHPLIKETANKAIHDQVENVQTGPAARGDMEIIKKHLEWLKDDDELKEVYSLLSCQLTDKNSENV